MGNQSVTATVVGEGRIGTAVLKDRIQGLIGPDGSFIEGRATRGMDRFAVRRDGDKVIVDLDKLYQQDKDRAEWNAAFIQV